jgi:hypothetical protein
MSLTHTLIHLLIHLQETGREARMMDAAPQAIGRPGRLRRHPARSQSPFLTLCSFLLLTGCGALHPLLRVAAVGETPEPNGIYETHIWNQAVPLDLVLKHTRGVAGDRIPLRLKAVHDGRAISIFARWPDGTKSSNRWSWVWNRETNDYQLEYAVTDQFTLLWPMEPGDRASCMLKPRQLETRYDAWRWIGGWSDIGGYAGDQVLTIRKSDGKSLKPDHKQDLYPIGHSGQFAGFSWIDDHGTPATTIRSKPFLHTRSRISGHESHPPSGSAADLRVRSVYNPKMPDIAANRFIEFYRLLKTGHADDDIQFDAAESFVFAVSIHDHTEGADHYVSGPIRLKFDKPSETIYQ